MNVHLPGRILGKLGFCLPIALLAVAAQPSHGGEAVAFATPALGMRMPTGRSPVLEESSQTLQSSNLMAVEIPTAKANSEEMSKVQMDLARKQRLARQFEDAKRLLVGLLEKGVSEVMQKNALLELALLAQEEKDLPRCQQVYAQYVSKWPQDHDVPEILFRQGLLYREMGSYQMAVAKFYAVMTSSLVVNNDRFDFYQRLVLQAQTEIADTQLMQGKPAEAEQSLAKLLKSDSKGLNRPRVLFKLVQALALQDRHEAVVSRGQEFVSRFPEAPELPELRFLMASAYKQLGRNGDTMQQVLLLLTQQKSSASPEMLVHWQQRTGNEIGNQLYREGDFLKALDVYQALAGLDQSASWQLPVLYQVGLIYEHLNQSTNAMSYYTKVLGRSAELQSPVPPSLKAVLEMARWRKDQLQWQGRLEASSIDMRRASLGQSLEQAPEISAAKLP